MIKIQQDMAKYTNRNYQNTFINFCISFSSIFEYYFHQWGSASHFENSTKADVRGCRLEVPQCDAASEVMKI